MSHQMGKKGWLKQKKRSLNASTTLLTLYLFTFYRMSCSQQFSKKSIIRSHSCYYALEKYILQCLCTNLQIVYPRGDQNRHSIHICTTFMLVLHVLNNKLLDFRRILDSHFGGTRDISGLGHDMVDLFLHRCLRQLLFLSQGKCSATPIQICEPK